MKQFRREMAKLSSIQKNLNRLKLIEKFSVKRKFLNNLFTDYLVLMLIKIIYNLTKIVTAQ